MKTINVVAAIIQDEEGHVLATQRGYGEYEGWWEFPGGKIEPGESHTTALVREIWEELSVMIMPDKWLCTVEYDYPNFHLTMHCALCHIAQGRVQLNEHASAKWLAKDELNSLQWLPADVEVVNSVITNHR
ncbi:MAG: (deoxy)nucleoside triphosphate pyrophosphohydrolase [Bacteroidaceae bacterium]|nr:(deoxy)nucleoside triphosphate pyrophosphohydrolase [Bacteroidaceae bacterium]